jgi:hypothetical protein
MLPDKSQLVDTTGGPDVPGDPNLDWMDGFSYDDLICGTPSPTMRKMVPESPPMPESQVPKKFSFMPEPMLDVDGVDIGAPKRRGPYKTKDKALKSAKGENSAPVGFPKKPVYNLPEVVYNLPEVVYNLPEVVYNLPAVDNIRRDTMEIVKFTVEFTGVPDGVPVVPNKSTDDVLHMLQKTSDADKHIQLKIASKLKEIDRICDSHKNKMKDATADLHKLKECAEMFQACKNRIVDTDEQQLLEQDLELQRAKGGSCAAGPKK